MHEKRGNFCIFYWKSLKKREKTDLATAASISPHILSMMHFISVKPRVMTPQSSVNFPKIDLKTAQNSAKQSKKRVMRAVFALKLAADRGRF